MRFPAILTSLAVAGSLIAVPAFTAQAQTETEDLSQCKNIQTRVSGGELRWGVKQSFRNYITGRIAKGKWTIDGNVTENGEAKGAANFQFIFPVDPETSEVNFDAEGNITGDSVVRTKDSTIIFEGHHGALYTNISKPYVEVSGTTAKHGVDYLGYYVPGKGMTEYTPEDRIEENKKTGTDTFTSGTATAWEKSGDDTFTLSTSGNKYAPKAGTGYDSDTKQQTIEGIDVIFMGMYDSSAEIDNSQITLTTERFCADVPEETTPPTTTNPAEPTTNPVDPVATTTAKPVTTTTAKPVTTTTAKPVTTTTAKPVTTTAKPAKPTASATTTSKPADNGGSSNGGFFDSFKGFWNKLLSFGSLFGLIGVLFQAFNSLGWFNVFGSSR